MSFFHFKTMSLRNPLRPAIGGECNSCSNCTGAHASDRLEDPWKWLKYCLGLLTRYHPYSQRNVGLAFKWCLVLFSAAPISTSAWESDKFLTRSWSAAVKVNSVEPSERAEANAVIPSSDGVGRSEFPFLAAKATIVLGALLSILICLV